MPEDNLSNNIQQINRCNQRGGRMLSIIDLIDRHTIDIGTAAFLAEKIRNNASFIVGAVPGGAGKTTVMCALLNLLPPDINIVPAEHLQIIKELKNNPVTTCALAHEISKGNYYCYLWGRELQEYFSLSETGHVLATNLHADTLEQARGQICEQNSVPVPHFNYIDMFLFLSVSGGFASKEVRISDMRIFSTQRNAHIPLSDYTPTVSKQHLSMWEELFTTLLENEVYAISTVRKEILDMFSQQEN